MKLQIMYRIRYFACEKFYDLEFYTSANMYLIIPVGIFLIFSDMVNKALDTG